VSQLLDISRLESGDRKFNFTDFDVAEVSRLILLSFEKSIDEKRLDVEFNSDDDAMWANADKDAIYQVIYNLCHNAIKFSAERGKFAINISHIANKKIKISIFDEGQTISAEDAKHI
jgi:signal transduction histidine kinase